MADSEKNLEGLMPTQIGETGRSSAFQAMISVPFDLRAQLVTMHVLSDEKVEQLISAGSPWPLAMFTLAVGTAAAILIALYSGGIVVAMQGTFWVAFWAMLILAVAFGGWALTDSSKTRRIKRAIKEQSKTVLKLPTAEIQSVENPLK